MFVKSIFVVYAFALACCHELTRVNLYYDSHCGGCIETYPEMVPMMEKLGDYVDCHTYPFGVCSMVNNTKGQILITCGHENEVYGNMVHGCAVDALIGLSTANGSAPLYIQFVSCVIQMKTTDESIDECGKKLGISTEILEKDIKGCAKSGLGPLIHIKNAVITLRDFGNDNLRYAPAMAVNGKIIPVQDWIQKNYKDLTDAVCKLMKNPPPVCKTL